MGAEGPVVVGIGASAGGVKALREFFANVPADTGMAYVVILHLSPSHESRLPEVLQATAAVPVTQVTAPVAIEPNHVYVISPNQSLGMRDGTLAPSDVAGLEERRAPVDIFFRTLAETHTSRAVCVVLSGTGHDGSVGLKRVKERGGLAVVQAPEEAEFDDMPRSSIATGLVDYVLPVSEIPARIAAYGRQIGSLVLRSEQIGDLSTDEQAVRELLTQLRVRTGHDFSTYKQATVLRRIARRVAVRQLPDLASYARYAREDDEEIRALLKDLLVSVTNFFRDREAFEALERDVVPKLFEGKRAGDQVRAWVVGCATGEEAYSVAMLLAEYAGDAPSAPAVQLFATDIDERAVAAARAGVYTTADVAGVSPERLQRYFSREGDAYRVRRELRESVLFAVHNVLRDPPFSHLDLVSCRNLLIYFNRSAQTRTLETIHFALRPGGFLLLGSSESVEGVTDRFATLDKEHRIFESRAIPRVLPAPAQGAGAVPAGRRPIQEGGDGPRVRLSYADVHQRLLERYAPPSVVVDENYVVVHLSERAGRYLQVAGGDASLDLLTLVRPELRLELRTALARAVERRTDVETRTVSLSLDGSPRAVTMVVRPVLRDDDPARGLVLVLFAEQESQAGDPPPPEALAQDEPVVRRLEDEVVQLRAQLRATVEQYEVHQEELKASNEELQAINEELRSATEELETSKEELQSVNEELTTVNQELKVKIDELSQANSDFQNLMASTEIGTIFLDRGLRIKLFTPRARDVFNVIPSDAGRPLLDITNTLAYEGLVDDVERVLETLERLVREVRTRDGRWFEMRVLPYRTAEDRIDGVVLTFIDITERKWAEEQSRASEERLRLVLESAREFAIFTITEDGAVDSWNSGAERIFGYREEEILGQSCDVLFTPEDRERGVPAAERRTAKEQGRANDERWHVRKDGSRFFASGVVQPLTDGATGFVKIARDLTAQRRAQEEIRRTRDELEVRVDDRTRELQQTNESLRGEVLDRKAAELNTRVLLGKIVTVQEDERSRIARDLHDQFGQKLTALGLHLEMIKGRTAGDAELARHVEEARALTRTLDEDVDYLAWELRPLALDELGLATALANYAAEWSRHSGIPAELHASRLGAQRLGAEAEINLYRIAQEALTNVQKHAEATRVSVILERRDDKVALIVEDDGRGFDPETTSRLAAGAAGLGLVGMRERAALLGGTLEVESAPGAGTTVFALVPRERGEREEPAP